MELPLSQHLAFAGESPPHEDDHWAPGGGLASVLGASLPSAGWRVDGPDVLTGSTWTLVCEADDQRLEISLAAASDGEWILMILPWNVPGWFGRLRKRKPSATPAACHRLAKDVQSSLIQHGCSDTRWCWDGDPWSDSTSPEPPPPGPAS